MYQDPWTGAGMDNASVHATFLAEALTAWLSGSAPEDEAIGRYVERRDAHALEGFHDSVGFGRDLNQLRA